MQLARRVASECILSAAVLAVGLPMALPVTASTVLTFDVAGGVTNFQAVPPDYGDNVAGTPQSGNAYGFVDDGLGFTPNVVAAYGAPDELPALWTTGYGDLTNVYFNDQDSDTTFTLTLAAASGFDATLFGFDIASFSSGGQTIAGLRVLDGRGDTLFSQGSTVVPGSGTGGHATLDFGPDGIRARVLELVIDLSGLGMRSDNVAIDNFVFAQVVPEPGTGMLVGAGLLAIALRRRGLLRER